MLQHSTGEIRNDTHQEPSHKQREPHAFIEWQF